MRTRCSEAFNDRDGGPRWESGAAFYQAGTFLVAGISSLKRVTRPRWAACVTSRAS